MHVVAKSSSSVRLGASIVMLALALSACTSVRGATAASAGAGELTALRGNNHGGVDLATSDHTGAKRCAN
ncbi:MAG TPA: hypothetical protein VE967_09640 [Gemmatimonadaceae bacterium]|nr:hypothetical protein [Gemmatimonadaceae bacterium]